jgi:hypothetical protein
MPNLLPDELRRLRLKRGDIVLCGPRAIKRIREHGVKSMRDKERLPPGVVFIEADRIEKAGPAELAAAGLKRIKKD